MIFLFYCSSGRGLTNKLIVSVFENLATFAHVNNKQVKVWYSDASTIQMFVIQIPTVYLTKNFTFRNRFSNLWFLGVKCFFGLFCKF